MRAAHGNHANLMSMQAQHWYASDARAAKGDVKMKR
jgi:hypothetical protein